MGGPESHGHVLVVAGSLVLVAHQHGDRGAQGCRSIQQAAEHLDPIRFLARGGDVTLTGPAPIQFLLDLLQIQIQPGGTPLHDHADATTMGFAECADPEEVAEAAAHGCSVL